MNKKLVFHKLPMMIVADIIDKVSEKKAVAPIFSLNGARLTNIISPLQESDLINFEFFNEFLLKKSKQIYENGEIIISTINNEITNLSAYSLNTLPITGGIMRGNINMGKTNTFINIPPPQNPSDILSLAYLRSAYVSLEEESSFLDFKGERNITDLADPKNPLDAINFQSLKDSIKSLNADSLQAISINGSTLKGNITIQNNCYIQGLQLPLNNEDAVCLFYLKQKIFPLTGGTLYGSLTFRQSATITNLKDPEHNGDIITLKSLKNAINTIAISKLNIVSLTGSSVNGDIKTKKVVGLIDPANPSDIVNLGSCQNIISLKISNKGDTFSGSLDCQNIYTLQNIRKSIFASDALDLSSLQDLNSNIIQLRSSAVLTSGATMQGNITMNQKTTPPFHRILNIAAPISDDHAITLGYLRSHYLPFSGGIISNPVTLNDNIYVNSASSFNASIVMEKSLSFNSHDPRSEVNFVSDLDPNHTITVTGLKAPLTDTDPINLDHLRRNFLMTTGGSLSASLSCLQNLTVANPTQLNNISISASSITFSLGKNKQMNLNGRTLNCINNLSRSHDIINLDSFSTITQHYLSKKGGKMAQKLDMNGSCLSHIPTPIQDNDSIPLIYLETNSYTLAVCIKNHYLDGPYTLWSNSSLLHWDWNGNSYRTSSNASAFFKMASYNSDENTAMFLKQGHLYSISIDIKPASPTLSSQPLTLSINRDNIFSILNIFETQSEIDYKFSVLWAAQKDQNLPAFSDATIMSLIPNRSSILISSLAWSFIALSTPL